MPQTDKVLSYLDTHHAAALQLAADGESSNGVALQDACDVVYTLALLGHGDRLTAAGAHAFAALARKRRLAGGLNTVASPDAEPAIVHLTAYVLGALALYREAGHDVAGAVLDAPHWSLGELVHPDGLPKWPAQWSHHGWRVSHWVGGAPSILYNLGRLAPQKAQGESAPALASVLEAADRVVDPRTGLLKCYRSDLVQKAFRALYRLRHDPDAGDVGGVVHLHWVNWASGRLPYKATGELFTRAKAVYARKPFIEATPYCLDFDVIQIVRTAAPSPADLDTGVKARAQAFLDDVADFMETRLDADYAIHKLPGALATQHEAALILGQTQVAHLDTPAIDIIKLAGWI